VKRITQKIDDLLGSMSTLDVDWKDQHIVDVEALFSLIHKGADVDSDLLKNVLRAHFLAAKTLLRSFLALSKDEFDLKLDGMLGGNGLRKFQEDEDRFVEALNSLGLVEAIRNSVERKYTWKDIILERLRSGRGSAIKGMKRGRGLEDEIEKIIKEIFGDNGYSIRGRFKGKSGLSTEKSDFAIPSNENPCILIEAKAYGATGSKQTDIIGDVSRIVLEKRRDTTFILVTDGSTWARRESDLSKLVKLQNDGEIDRIYTTEMFDDFRTELKQLKTEYGIN